MWQTIKQQIVYMRRGHASYTGFMLSILSFCVIFHQFVIGPLFGWSLLQFTIVFVPPYLVLVGLGGKRDYFKLTFPEEIGLVAKLNPMNHELMTAFHTLGWILTAMAEGNLPGALKYSDQLLNQAATWLEEAEKCAN